MSLNATRARLEQLAKELFRNWDETKAVWRDSRAQEFEEKFIPELSTRLRQAEEAMEKLDQLISKVREDCDESY